MDPPSLSPAKNTALQATIYLLYGIGPLTGNVVQVLLPLLVHDFSAPPGVVLAAALIAFMVPFSITQLFSGAWSENRGRVFLISFGLVLFGAGMVIATLATSLGAYIVANLIAGLGFGLINPVIIALMTDITPPGPIIARKMAYLSACATFSTGIGPLLAGIFAVVNWRLLYLLIAVLALFSLVVLLALRLPSRVGAHQGEAVEPITVQIRQELRSPVVIVMVAGAFLISHCILGATIWTSRAVSGLINPALYGIGLGFAGIIGALATIAFGFMIKRTGPRMTMSLSFISLVAGLCVLILAGKNLTSDFPMVELGLVLVLVAGGGPFPIIMYYSQSIVPTRRGALAGLSQFGYFAGIALVSFDFGPVYAFGVSWVFAGMIVVGCLLLALVLLVIKKGNAMMASLPPRGHL
jgi:MFS family permease